MKRVRAKPATASTQPSSTHEPRFIRRKLRRWQRRKRFSALLSLAITCLGFAALLSAQPYTPSTEAPKDSPVLPDRTGTAAASSSQSYRSVVKAPERPDTSNTVLTSTRNWSRNDPKRSVIYANRQSSIIFDHRRHAKLECTTCHQVEPADHRSTNQAKSSHDGSLRTDVQFQNPWPSMEVCASCHTDQAQPFLQNCSGCHRDFPHNANSPILKPEDWRAFRPIPMPRVKTPPRIRFDHARHIRKSAPHSSGPTYNPFKFNTASPAPMAAPLDSLKLPSDPQAQTPPQALDSDKLHNHHLDSRSKANLACLSCHGSTSELREVAKPTPAKDTIQLPTMQQCLQCHNGRSADAACATCHLSEQSGRLRTGFDYPVAQSTKKTKQRLLPSNHAMDWIARHGALARAETQNCTTCHTEESCLSCHQASTADIYAVHPPNYIAVHSVDARASQPNCTECHSLQTFCQPCHINSNAVPTSENQPPLKRDFHPPDWLVSTSPNNHGVVARRNINDCVSCHTERDCLSCHQGVNPHPPGYAADCSRWLNANARACVKCHTDLSQLRTRCF